MNDHSSAVLFGSLAQLARDHGQRSAVDDGDGRETTFAELLDECQSIAAKLHGCARRRVGVVLPASPAWVASLAALDRVGASACLLHPETDERRLADLASTLGLDAVLRVGATSVSVEELRPPSDSDNETAGCVTLLTSGTTGKPKAVLHDWRSLRRPVRLDARFVGTRWLLTNPPNLYAGLQVFLQCFLNAGTLVVLPAGLGPTDVCESMLRARVQYVSSTPSFWRRLLSFGSVEQLAQLQLRQVTLGGEPAPAELLRDLAGLFPSAHLSHIYATSELGRCFSVTDGRAGFPVRFLQECPEPGVSLRVVDGELHACSPNQTLRRSDGTTWIPTGDLVEIVGDRVIFRGRKTDIINVGGNKVQPLEIETVLRKVQGVVDARVYPIASSLVGQMVAADVVVEPGSDTDSVRRGLTQQCVEALQPHQRPRRWTFVSELKLTSAGKISRAGQPA